MFGRGKREGSVEDDGRRLLYSVGECSSFSGVGPVDSAIGVEGARRKHLQYVVVNVEA